MTYRLTGKLNDVNVTFEFKADSLSYALLVAKTMNTGWLLIKL